MVQFPIVFWVFAFSSLALFAFALATLVKNIKRQGFTKVLAFVWVQMSFTIGYALVYLAVALLITKEFNAESQNEIEHNKNFYDLVRLGIFYAIRLLSL